MKMKMKRIQIPIDLYSVLSSCMPNHKSEVILDDMVLELVPEDNFDHIEDLQSHVESCLEQIEQDRLV